MTDEFFDSIRNPVNWGDGVTAKCSLLLTGPPGTGKTSAVKAAANEGKAMHPEEVLIFAPEVADLLNGKDATQTAAKLTAGASTLDQESTSHATRPQFLRGATYESSLPRRCEQRRVLVRC